MPDTEKNNRPISSLFSDLLNELTELMRQEILLAKREFSDKVNQITSGGVSLAAGGAVLFAGFLALLHCAELALANVMAPWLAALIVGGVVAIVGLILVLKGRSKLKTANLAPQRTMESLQRDKELAQEHVRR